MQCNYNSFIQIINFHGLFRNALRCRKTGACRILVPLRYTEISDNSEHFIQWQGVHGLCLGRGTGGSSPETPGILNCQRHFGSPSGIIYYFGSDFQKKKLSSIFPELFSVLPPPPKKKIPEFRKNTGM